jgi:RHH-type rel operon transcriptional repressor/antitoxin RelB
VTKMLAIRLPEKVERRLARLAKRARRTKSDLAREAILEHLEDLEDYYLALARLEDQLQSIPLQEVERRLGLED